MRAGYPNGRSTRDQETSLSFRRRLQLMTPEATYVSLNFDDPELKRVMPWTGTHKGPQALADVFGAIQRFWKTLDFKVTNTIEQGSRVALFGFFTYKSNVTGKEITSSIWPLGAFRGG